MSFCSECGTNLSDTAKFCGNCGTSRTQAKEPASNAASSDSDQESYGEGADKIIGFFGGFYFKALAAVLAVIGIAYALATGGLGSSGVPSPAESYMMQDGWSPVPKKKYRPQPGARKSNNPAAGRYEAYKRQRSNSHQPSSRNRRDY